MSVWAHIRVWALILGWQSQGSVTMETRAGRGIEALSLVGAIKLAAQTASNNVKIWILSCAIFIWVKLILFNILFWWYASCLQEDSYVSSGMTLVWTWPFLDLTWTRTRAWQLYIPIQMAITIMLCVVHCQFVKVKTARVHWQQSLDFNGGR